MTVSATRSEEVAESTRSQHSFPSPRGKRVAAFTGVVALVAAGVGLSSASGAACVNSSIYAAGSSCDGAVTSPSSGNFIKMASDVRFVQITMIGGGGASGGAGLVGGNGAKVTVVFDATNGSNFLTTGSRGLAWGGMHGGVKKNSGCTACFPSGGDGAIVSPNNSVDAASSGGGKAQSQVMATAGGGGGSGSAGTGGSGAYQGGPEGGPGLDLLGGVANAGGGGAFGAYLSPTRDFPYLTGGGGTGSGTGTASDFNGGGSANFPSGGGAGGSYVADVHGYVVKSVSYAATGGSGAGAGGTNGSGGANGSISFAFSAKMPRSITLPTNQGSWDGPVSLAAQPTAGSDPISYVVAAGGTASGCTIVNSTVTATSAGTCLVDASVAETDDYLAASTVTPTTITFTRAPRTISLADDSGIVSTNVQLAATISAGSGTPSYSAANGTATGCNIVGGAVTATSSGTCIVTASVGASADYVAATTSATFTFTWTLRTVTLADGAGVVGSPVSLAAVVSGGTDAVTYSIAPGGTADGCSITGDILTATGPGSCLVKAAVDEVPGSFAPAETASPATFMFTAPSTASGATAMSQAASWNPFVMTLSKRSSRRATGTAVRGTSRQVERLQFDMEGRYTLIFVNRTTGKRIAQVKGSAIGFRVLSRDSSAPVFIPTRKGQRIVLRSYLRSDRVPKASGDLYLRVIRRAPDGSLSEASVAGDGSVTQGTALK